MTGPTIVARGVTFEASGKTILSGVNLAFRPGEIAAVIGPSGCGKSTLLKCLTTAYTPTDGSVLVDGDDMSKSISAYRQRLAYVPQDDIIHRELRVSQAFYYAARLRLGEERAEEEIEKRIEETARQLDLSEQKRQRIRSLSGGQRKRVNIGIELLAEPDVLVLDEPASGLDLATEEDLVKVLRRLAGEGRTVIMTTHSVEYLSRVNMIIMLLEGTVIFAGTLKELLAHFKITHVADVFKTIRKNNTAAWLTHFSRSPLAAKAMRS